MSHFAPRTLHRLTAITTGIVLLAAGLSTAPSASAVEGRLDTELTVGESLVRGDSLVSPNGRVRLQLDQAGALTLVDRGSGGGYPGALVVRDWTKGTSIDRLVMQADGNLVGKTAAGAVRVDVGTGGSGAVAARVQDDRDLVVTDPAGNTLRSTGTGRNSAVPTGDFLLPGDTVRGERGASRLVMQTDGNLVLYRGSTVAWHSRTNGNPGAWATMQADGNFVVYASPAAGRRALWSSRTPWLAPRDHGRVLVEDSEISVELVGGEHRDDERYPLWTSSWASNRVLSGDELDDGDRRTSANGRCQVGAHQSGLFLACDGRTVWTTRSAPVGYGSTLVGLTRMQADGNLVGYRYLASTGGLFDVTHATRTSVPGSYLVVQDDGNLVVRAPDGRPVWSRLTGTIR